MKLVLFKISFLFLLTVIASCTQQINSDYDFFEMSGFYDSEHHWYDINDSEKIISPVIDQPRYSRDQIEKIADNMLLFQKENGGWPKNYDMTIILTDQQKDILKRHKSGLNTTFDNGATYNQTEYLAKVFHVTGKEKYKNGFLKGLEFILASQYSNGGWPQCFPDTTGYQKYITFNDGAMIGIMKFLKNIVEDNPVYKFLSLEIKQRVINSYRKGIDCIINCQINEGRELSVWCQQHDNITFEPRGARTYELDAICNMESAEIVEFLMSIENPDQKIINAVKSAVNWFEKSRIYGIRVETVNAQPADYKYHSTSVDRIVINDQEAPPIWPRFNELETHQSLFCNRDGIKVYSMAEVERERRTGYAWYTYAPQLVIDKFSSWHQKIK